jgi:Tat protein translocase TatB subunit
MFESGWQEIILVCIIGLLVLGPQRLPKVAAEIGKWVGRARRTATQLRRQLEREVELAELEKPIIPPKPPPPPTPPPSPPPTSTSTTPTGEVPPGPGTHSDQTLDAETSAAAAIDKAQPAASASPERGSAARAPSSPSQVDQTNAPQN